MVSAPAEVKIFFRMKKDDENGGWNITECQSDHRLELLEIIVTGIAKRFVMEGMGAAFRRNEQKNRHHKLTGDVEARIYTIICSNLPEDVS